MIRDDLKECDCHGPVELEYCEHDIKAAEHRGARAIRERAANVMDKSPSDILLMAGELSGAEMRLIRALFTALRAQIRAMPLD